MAESTTINLKEIKQKIIEKGTALVNQRNAEYNAFLENLKYNAFLENLKKLVKGFNKKRKKDAIALIDIHDTLKDNGLSCCYNDLTDGNKIGFCGFFDEDDKHHYCVGVMDKEGKRGVGIGFKGNALEVFENRRSIGSALGYIERWWRNEDGVKELAKNIVVLIDGFEGFRDKYMDFVKSQL